ncbi:MAG TPA: haloalkane dehalogenase [Gaiellaceae bacterium]
MSVYRTPDESFDSLPGYSFGARYVEQEGLRMHYVDEGEGDPVLLLHGEPTWSYLYRKVIPPVAEVARAIAPDYFGFGRSDKPVERDWYTYDAHYRSIERLVDELDLRRVTVVVQDWGGPIGLRLAVSRPDRVERIVVMNTGVFAGRPPSEQWLQFREFVRRLDTEMRAGQLVRITCATELADDVVAAYDAPFPVAEAKSGMVMFPELVPTESSHPSGPAMLSVREGLRSWTRPALVFFSDSDPIFSPRVAERFAELIPGAELLRPVEGAGHFLQEDAGEEVGARIAKWLRATKSDLAD